MSRPQGSHELASRPWASKPRLSLALQDAPDPTATDGEPVRTLGELFLRSEQVHERAYALKEWRGGMAELWPDWRLRRQILRAAVYLRERARVGPGCRVGVVGTLGARSLVVEWAAVLLGATAALVAPSQLCGPAVLQSLGARTIFDVDVMWAQALDPGSGGDLAEQAHGVREAAWAIRPETPALAFLEEQGAAAAWRTLSHEQAMARVLSLWRANRTGTGDVRLPALRGASLPARLVLYAYVGDGRTRIALHGEGSGADRV